MEHIGAGLAALGVIGPGIGIGILAGLASDRHRPQPRRGRPDPRPGDHPRRRSPKASASSRSSSASSRSSSSQPSAEIATVDLLAVAGAAAQAAAA